MSDLKIMIINEKVNGFFFFLTTSCADVIWRRSVNAMYREMRVEYDNRIRWRSRWQRLKQSLDDDFYGSLESNYICRPPWEIDSKDVQQVRVIQVNVGTDARSAIGRRNEEKEREGFEEVTVLDQEVAKFSKGEEEPWRGLTVEKQLVLMTHLL